ncbi:MAG: hypothetical protein IT384_05545 [Deltaproteobacteria bacterium]|nr:hypothetical protein [Deltaproteobacteria bacterium]
MGRRSVLTVPLVIKGEQAQGAELTSAPGPVRIFSVGEGHRLLEELRHEGVRWVYGTPSPSWPEVLLRELGFHHAFDLVQRNFYLSLSGISSRLDDTLAPVRRVAKLARRFRQRLIEVDFDPSWLAYAARLFEQRRPELGFAVARTEQQLAERFAAQAKERGCHLLVLRRQAGVGIDGFAIVKLSDPGTGQRVIRLLDHWTRLGEVRSTTWLLGELALWGLSEHAQVIEVFAVAGTALEHILIGAGCIKKPRTAPFLLRSLEPGEETRVIPASDAQLRAGDVQLFQ